MEVRGKKTIKNDHKRKVQLIYPFVDTRRNNQVNEAKTYLPVMIPEKIQKEKKMKVVRFSRFPGSLLLTLLRKKEKGD